MRPHGMVRVLGEVMIDTLVLTPRDIAVGSDTQVVITDLDGGSAANLAAWLAHVGSDVELIACLGTDSYGDAALEHLMTAGVLPRVDRHPELPTGRCIVLVGPSGERTMLPDPGANAALGVSSLGEATWGPQDHLHVSGYSLMRPVPRETALRAIATARERKMTVSVDASSSAPLTQMGPQSMLDPFRAGDIVFANADEARVLTGEADPRHAAAALAVHGLMAVVKAGADGAFLDTGALQARASAVSVPVVDSTGAGDAFAAGFLAAWRDGSGPRTCLEAATRLASQAVARLGARP